MLSLVAWEVLCALPTCVDLVGWTPILRFPVCLARGPVVARSLPSSLLALVASSLLIGDRLLAMPAIRPAATESGVARNLGLADLRIPIDVPAGTGGFEPDLTLAYSSLASDGPFGVGWQLRLGEIRRSLRFGTSAYDGTDQYELDGELLVPNPTGGRYHTLTERFALITQIGSEWVVTFPNGNRAHFGVDESSRIRRDGSTGPIARWLLGKLVDVSGNEVRFVYDRSDDGTAYLTQVSYTWRGSSLVGSERRVEVLYESRSDPSLTFPGGVRTELTKRAKEIRSTVGGQPHRRRILSYDEDPYGTVRSRLTSSQLFGSDCPPSQIEPGGELHGPPEGDLRL
jgi:hypothetical protein